jgi:hypothetical protein
VSEIHSYQTLYLSPLKLWVSSISFRLCTYHHLSCEWVPFLSDSVPITTEVVSEFHSYQTLYLSPLKLWVSSIPIRLCTYHHLSCEWDPFLSDSVPITTEVVSEFHSYQTMCLSPLKLWVSSIPSYAKIYLIQTYVVKFFQLLGGAGGYHWVL